MKEPKFVQIVLTCKNISVSVNVDKLINLQIRDKDWPLDAPHREIIFYPDRSRKFTSTELLGALLSGLVLQRKDDPDISYLLNSPSHLIKIINDFKTSDHLPTTIKEITNYPERFIIRDAAPVTPVKEPSIQIIKYR